MKTTSPSPALPESPNGLWQTFGMTTWLLIGGLVLLNVGCFLSPSILDTVLSVIFFPISFLFHLLDFRTWAWWYFPGVIAGLVFSVRWFFLYQTYVNDDFDPQSLDEAKWFCLLSGTITFTFAVFAFLHRFCRYFLLYYLYYPLETWLRLGHGAFSYIAILAFTVSLVIIAFVIYFAWRWITSLSID